MGVIKGDTRSLDYSSHEDYGEVIRFAMQCTIKSSRRRLRVLACRRWQPRQNLCRASPFSVTAQPSRSWSHQPAHQITSNAKSTLAGLAAAAQSDGTCSKIRYEIHREPRASRK